MFSKQGSRNAKGLAYMSLVRPILEYGSACWDSCREGIAVNKYVKKRLELRALCFTPDLHLSSPPRWKGSIYLTRQFLFLTVEKDDALYSTARDWCRRQKNVFAFVIVRSRNIRKDPTESSREKLASGMCDTVM
jgi:hypothetical protein